MIFKIWFFRKLSDILFYWMVWSFENDRFALYRKLYCWRLKVDKLLVKLALHRHIKELKK